MNPLHSSDCAVTQDLGALQQIESVCEAFERAWLQGSPPALEDVLATVDNRLRPELFCELLRLDMAYRSHRGETPTATDYVTTFPQWESLIHSVFPLLAGESPTIGGPAPPAVAAVTPGEPRTVNRYRVNGLYAEGGLGRIWKATDPDLRRVVALKQLKEHNQRDPVTELRFIREARITARLEHPGIVPVYGLGTDPAGRTFYVMRLVQGATLRARIDQLHASPDPWNSGPWLLELRNLLTRFVAVCRTIDYAHSRGVVHRDLKPGNILLGEFGETLVLDWGLAKPVGTVEQPFNPAEATADFPPDASNLTTTGSVVGTPAYMSPEQAAGTPAVVAISADIYSLGATLVTLLTGKPPVEGMKLEDVIRQVYAGTLVFPRERQHRVPRGLDAICRRALQRSPGDRYPSAGQLADDLERWLAGEAVSVLPESSGEQLGRWLRRHRVLTASTTMVVLTAVVLGLASLAWMESTRNRQEYVALIEGLAHCELSAVSRLQAELSGASVPRTEVLRQRYLQAVQDGDAVARRNLRFALLPHDPQLIEAAFDDLLHASPPDFLTHAGLLLPQAEQLARRCRGMRSSGRNHSERQLRIAAALAVFAPGDANWPLWAESTVEQLCAEPVVTYAAWRPVFQPVAAHLKTALANRFDGHEETSLAYPAAAWISLLYSSDLNFLVERLQQADELQLLPLILALRKDPPQAVPLLAGALRQREPVSVNLPSARQPHVERTRRRARAAAALLALGHPEIVLPEVDSTANPTFNALLIHLVRRAGVVPEQLARWWTEERLTGRRRILTLMLGQFQPEHLARERFTEIVNAVSAVERTESDPGLHSACRWLLTRWQAPPERPHQVYAPDRRWYETRAGETFVTVQGPVEFLMGSPHDELYGNGSADVLHLRRIPRSIAIAACEATQELVQKRLGDYPRHGRPGFHQPGSPALCLTLYDCAKYCRILSEEEGIPEDQMCFPPVDQIGPGMELPADYLQRTGYRLPSEAEWEYFAKAGTITSTSYGDDFSIASDYAWNANNSGGFANPVGRLMPNPLGLFDVHGNVGEWTIERSSIRKSYADHPAWGPVVLDDILHLRLPVRRTVIVRGGFAALAPLFLRSTERRELPPEADLHEFGLRPIRTLPADWQPFDAVRSLDTPPDEARFRVTGDGLAFEVKNLSAGIEVSPLSGITPAEIVVTSPAGDSRRFSLDLIERTSGKRRPVAGTLVGIEWTGRVERLRQRPTDEAIDTPSLARREWLRYRTDFQSLLESGEPIRRRGDFHWIPEPGPGNPDRSSQDHALVLTATARPGLPPDDYFMQVRGSHSVTLSSIDGPLYDHLPLQGDHLPGRNSGTVRLSSWDPAEIWKLTVVTRNAEGETTVTLRPIPGPP